MSALHYEGGAVGNILCFRISGPFIRKINVELAGRAGIHPSDDSIENFHLAETCSWAAKA